MARATDSEISQYPGQIHGEIFFQRDLLQRLMAGKCRNNEESMSPDEEYPGDLELNLGLSLGGCFADKEKKLVRSSSIADPATAWRLPQPLGLIRSCSVPAANLLPDSPEWLMDPGIPAAVVAGDRRRKRRELHALKRKRWVTDRAGCGRDAGRVGGSGECCEEDKREGVEEEEEDEVEEETLTLALTGKKTGICPGSMGNAGAGLPTQPSIGNGLQLPYKAMPAVQDWERNLNLNHPNGKTGGFPPVGSRAFTPSSQASLGSQGSSSSGVSEFESKPVQGFGISGSNCNLDARSTASMQSLPEQSDQRATPVTAPLTILGRSGKSIGEGVQNPAKKSKISSGERNVMEEMPCVSTRGEGPNGKRIEGFLYKYKKGEEVRIVCVCHGSFLSPAEFVKHAGGGDVAHPLRHIVVNPSPSFFL